MHSAHREVHYGYIKVIISDVDDWMTPWTHLSVMPLHIHINTCRDTTRLHHSTTMTIISCCILSSPLPLNWPIPGSIDLDSLHYNSWTLYQSLSHSNTFKLKQVSIPYHFALRMEGICTGHSKEGDPHNQSECHKRFHTHGWRSWVWFSGMLSAAAGSLDLLLPVGGLVPWSYKSTTAK